MSDRFVSWALDDQNQIGMKALHFLDWFRTVHSRIMQITGGYAWTGCKVLCKTLGKKNRFATIFIMKLIKCNKEEKRMNQEPDD